MDLLTLLFRLPLMPLRGFLWLSETLRDEAERELRDPANVRRQLEQAEAEARAGHLSQDELSRVQVDATARMLGPAATGGRRATHSVRRGTWRTNR